MQKLLEDLKELGDEFAPAIAAGLGIPVAEVIEIEPVKGNGILNFAVWVSSIYTGEEIEGRTHYLYRWHYIGRGKRKRQIFQIYHNGRWVTFEPEYFKLTAMDIK